MAEADGIPHPRSFVAPVVVTGSVRGVKRVGDTLINIPPWYRKHNMNAAVDVSRSAQIRDIEASFNATESFSLSTLRHPNKPDVTAVDSYDVFPDAEIWANAYDLFRFSERPGERPPDVSRFLRGC